MNMLKNDKGEIVCQEGAPNSNARIRCQYPALLDRLTSLYNQGARIDTAIEEIREAGVTDEHLTLHILHLTSFQYDPMMVIVEAVTTRPAPGKEGK